MRGTQNTSTKIQQYVIHKKLLKQKTDMEEQINRIRSQSKISSFDIKDKLGEFQNDVQFFLVIKKERGRNADAAANQH